MALPAGNKVGPVLLSPCPPQAGSWCSRLERRPYVRLYRLAGRASKASDSDLGFETRRSICPLDHRWRHTPHVRRTRPHQGTTSSTLPGRWRGWGGKGEPAGHTPHGRGASQTHSKESAFPSSASILLSFASELSEMQSTAALASFTYCRISGFLIPFLRAWVRNSFTVAYRAMPRW